MHFRPDRYECRRLADLPGHLPKDTPLRPQLGRVRGAPAEPFTAENPPPKPARPGGAEISSILHFAQWIEPFQADSVFEWRYAVP